MKRELAEKIKAVILDGDGVFFDGTVLVGKFYNNPKTGCLEIGEIAKRRCYYDGQGISLLRDAGILVAFVSSETSGFLEAVGNKLNSLPSVQSGKWPPIGVFTGHAGKDKVKTIDEWLKKNKIDWSEVCYMGDDLTDLQIIQKVKREGGLTAAPAQAEKTIKKLVDFISERPGGFGAIRDLSNFILEAKGIDQSKLTLK